MRLTVNYSSNNTYNVLSYDISDKQRLLQLSNCSADYV